MAVNGFRFAYPVEQDADHVAVIAVMLHDSVIDVELRLLHHQADLAVPILHRLAIGLGHGLPFLFRLSIAGLNAILQPAHQQEGLVNALGDGFIDGAVGRLRLRHVDLRAVDALVLAPALVVERHRDETADNRGGDQRDHGFWKFCRPRRRRLALGRLDQRHGAGERAERAALQRDRELLAGRGGLICGRPICGRLVCGRLVCGFCLLRFRSNAHHIASRLTLPLRQPWIMGPYSRETQGRYGDGAKVVPQEGFEPPTPSLRMRCSTS